MMRRGGVIIVLVVALCVLSGCRRPHAATPAPAPPVEKSDLTAEANAWADSMCRSLSLRQKVAQLFMPAVFASADEWTARLIRQYADSCVGGLVLLKGDSAGAKSVVLNFAGSSRVPSFVAIDAEWGLSMRLADAPRFPAQGDITTTDDQIMYEYGRELARECRLIGINMVLGPVVDIASRNSFMGRRSLGEDPARVADLALAYARGLEDGDVISVAKHFPGHGSVAADSHKRKGVIDRSLNEMDSIDLYPFRMWVQQRLTGVMVGHLAVPSIDSQMRPAAVSPIVINDLLRTDLGFSGLILTDALNMLGAEGHSSAEALDAGADIVVAPDNTFREIDDVVRAVGEGSLDEAVINDRVKRVLFYKYLAAPQPDSAAAAEPLNGESTAEICSRLRMR